MTYVSLRHFSTFNFLNPLFILPFNRYQSPILPSSTIGLPNFGYAHLLMPAKIGPVSSSNFMFNHKLLVSALRPPLFAKFTVSFKSLKFFSMSFPKTTNSPGLSASRFCISVMAVFILCFAGSF